MEQVSPAIQLRFDYENNRHPYYFVNLHNENKVSRPITHKQRILIIEILRELDIIVKAGSL